MSHPYEDAQEAQEIQNQQVWTTNTGQGQPVHHQIPPMTTAQQHAFLLNEEMNALDMELMGQTNYNTIMIENGYGNPAFTENQNHEHEHEHEQGQGHHGQLLVHNSDDLYGLAHNEHAGSTDNINDDVNITYSTLHIHVDDEEDEHVLHEGYDHDYFTDSEESPSPVATQLSAPISVTQQHQLEQALFEAAHAEEVMATQPDAMAQLAFHQQTNLSFSDFHRVWATWIEHAEEPSHRNRPKPDIQYLNELESSEVGFVYAECLDCEECDIQGINWKRLGVSRKESRVRRESMYVNYANTGALRQRSFHAFDPLEDNQNFFRFRRMDFTSKPRHAHFQLRNLIACTGHNSVYYAGLAEVRHSFPLYNTSRVAMDLSDPEIASEHFQYNDWGMAISTIAANHGLLIAGGFGGEYALRRTFSTSNDYVMGQVTEDLNGITNHIEIILNRRSDAPQAVFSNNDRAIRVLDIATQKVTQTFMLDWAVNCSAISTDARLRVAVGDSTTVLILNEETGQVMQELDGPQGHKDFGFSAAWADNGFHVATGNQDMMVKIWDARMWTRNGRAAPLATVPSQLAGVRSLKFSPIGSGKRVLVAAEQADVISIIDGESYETKQHFDFYGEILGTAFTPDGQNLFVGINDEHKGGIMEFEKCGFGLKYQARRVGKYMQDDFDDDGPGCKFRRGENGKLYDTYDNNGDESCQRTKDEVRREAMNVGEDWAPTMEESFARSRNGKTATWRRSKAGEGSNPL